MNSTVLEELLTEPWFKMCSDVSKQPFLGFNSESLELTGTQSKKTQSTLLFGPYLEEGINAKVNKTESIGI